MKSQEGQENFPYLHTNQSQTRDIAAQKAGIGSGKQYEREKYIVDNRDALTPEDFAEKVRKRQETRTDIVESFPQCIDTGKTRDMMQPQDLVPLRGW